MPQGAVTGETESDVIHLAMSEAQAHRIKLRLPVCCRSLSIMQHVRLAVAYTQNSGRNIVKHGNLTPLNNSRKQVWNTSNDI